MSILEVRGLKKIYSTRFGGNNVEALRNVNFTVEEGEYVAVMGESGSGKTTLLNILAALDKPTNGNVVLDGKDLSKIKEKDVRETKTLTSQTVDKVAKPCRAIKRNSFKHGISFDLS